MGPGVGDAEGCLVGYRLGDEEGTPVGTNDGVELGESLGCKLGSVLGLELGEILGNGDGSVVGPRVGNQLGVELGERLGTDEGPSVGNALGIEVGLSLGTSEGAVVGCVDGTMLVLGALLGAGLLLGTLLGRSVGHDSLVGDVAKSLQMLMWVTAPGPSSLTDNFDTDGTSTTTCLNPVDAEGSTTNDRVAPSVSITCTTALSTTFMSPTSKTSSTGVKKSNTRTPPASLAFH